MTTTIPPLNIISESFSLLHRVHGAARLVQRASTLPVSAGEALFGNGLYLAARELAPVRQAAQALLIVRRTLLCIESVEKVQRIFQIVINAMDERHLPQRLIRERLSRLPSSHPAHIIQKAPDWLIGTAHKLSILIKKITSLAVAIFHTALSLFALLEAAVPDEITIFEGITEIASNAREVYEAFRRGAPGLVRAVRCHQAVIDHILCGTGLPFRCDDIFCSASIAGPLSLADQKAAAIFEKIKEIISYGLEGLFNTEIGWLQPSDSRSIQKEYYYL